MVHQPAIFEACEAFKHDQMHPEMFHCSECKERTWANEKQSKIEYRGTICVRCIDQQKKDAKETGDRGGSTETIDGCMSAKLPIASRIIHQLT